MVYRQKYFPSIKFLKKENVLKIKDIVYILYYITECTSIKQITLNVYGFMGLFVKVIELIINGKVPIYS